MRYYPPRSQNLKTNPEIASSLWRKKAPVRRISRKATENTRTKKKHSKVPLIISGAAEKKMHKKTVEP